MIYHLIMEAEKSYDLQSVSEIAGKLVVSFESKCRGPRTRRSNGVSPSPRADGDQSLSLQSGRENKACLPPFVLVRPSTG